MNSTMLAAPSAPSNSLIDLLNESRLKRLSLLELETRLTRIDSRLDELAKPSMQMGEGAGGYRSTPVEDPDSTISIQIELDGEQAIDQIILAPSIWRDTQTGFRADGFPLEFQVFAGTADDQKGQLIAAYSEEDRLLPRVAPLVISCPDITASWVRIKTTKLSRWAWNNQPILQLSEILIFSGQRNVALRQTVDVTSNEGDTEDAPNKRYLVDGFMPYVMDAQSGAQSIAFVSLLRNRKRTELSIDLESVYRLDQIHLHSTDLSDTVPQSVPSDFGVPTHLIVEGAMSSDFSDAVTLVDYQKQSVDDAGPIIMRQFPATECRYVRLVALKPYTRKKRGIEGSQIGFAEIELFSDGRNVALHKKVTSKLSRDSKDRSMASITDGNNLYGQILPIKTWLGQLALRHDLEALRPLVAAELKRRYQRQRANMVWLTWVAGFLAVASIVAVLVGINLRDRAVARTREQIAADLHDELGANCHAIGLLSDLAQASSGSPKELQPLMKRIRELTQRTGSAASHCVNMLESQELFEDLETGHTAKLRPTVGGSSTSGQFARAGISK